MKKDPSSLSAHEYLSNFLLGKIDYSFLGTKREVLIDSGFYHLFVISGFHIGLVFYLIYKLFNSFLLIVLPYHNCRLIATILSIILCLYYIFLCGFPVSAIRALAIISIYMLCRNFHIKINVFNTLILLFISFIIISPKILNNPGFLYSFANSMALVYYFSNQDNITNQNKIISLYKSSLICFFASAPITLAYFHKIQFAAIISNIIAIPLFSYLVFPSSIIAYITSFELLINIAIYFHNLLISFATFISDFAILNLEVIKIDKIELILLTTSCLFIIILKLKNYFIGIIICLIILQQSSYKNFDIIKLTAIPRSITIYNQHDKTVILTNSKFNLAETEYSSCEHKSCILNVRTNKILILKNSIKYYDFLDNCTKYNLIINLGNNYSCHTTPTITSSQLFFKKNITIMVDEKQYYLIKP